MGKGSRSRYQRARQAKRFTPAPPEPATPPAPRPPEPAQVAKDDAPKPNPYGWHENVLVHLPTGTVVAKADEIPGTTEWRAKQKALAA